MKTFNIKRGLAVITAGAYLITTLGAAPVEASFWEDRARARRSEESGGPSGGFLLAQLPSAVRPPLTSFSARVPASSAVLTPGTAAPAWARSIVTPHAEVRSVWEGSAEGPRVILVLDAHDVVSAQRNVAGFLQRFQRERAPLVGVEGTTGAFALDRYRNGLPPVEQQALMDHLLKKGFLNGVELFALTADHTPTLWGVEDAALYEANVRAYRNALPVRDSAGAALKRLKADAQKRAGAIFSPALRGLMEEITARHEDRGDAGRYAELLAEVLGEAVGPQTRLFLRAKRLEDGFSFSEVEQARAAFIERVSPRLSPMETQTLVRLTADFRAGSLSAREYYDRLKNAAASKGVPVSAYPPFQKYIDYVAAADAVVPADLLEEWDGLELKAAERLAQPMERPLVDWLAELRLIERAMDHALTPSEWARYQRRNSARRGGADGPLMAGVPAEDLARVREALPVFESFFKAADDRNAALLNNLLAEAARRGTNDAVLVAGGFHAPALRALLEARGLSHAVVVPFMTDVPEDGAGYLQAFAPTRTPLERLLLGDRLFLNPPSATSASVRDPTSPYRDAATALDRAALVYSAPLVDAPAWRALLKKWGGKVWSKQDLNEGRRTTEIRFAGAARSVVIAAPVAGGAAGEALARSVEEKGARVVETDAIGGVPYVLGGENRSSRAARSAGRGGVSPVVRGVVFVPAGALVGSGRGRRGRRPDVARAHPGVDLSPRRGARGGGAGGRGATPAARPGRLRARDGVVGIGAFFIVVPARDFRRERRPQNGNRFRGGGARAPRGVGRSIGQFNRRGVGRPVPFVGRDGGRAGSSVGVVRGGQPVDGVGVGVRLADRPVRRRPGVGVRGGGRGVRRSQREERDVAGRRPAVDGRRNRAHAPSRRAVRRRGRGGGARERSRGIFFLH